MDTIASVPLGHLREAGLPHSHPGRNRSRRTEEIKEATGTWRVYPNHMIQNLAYCALADDQMQMRVPYGLVIYGGEQVRRVEYNEANRLWLHKVIAEVRMARSLPRVKRNHQMRGRCSGCGLRQQGDQSLANSG
jgi:CRISPR/Cas system-associated exonuclease Cas4 (RecB family)